MLRDYHCLARQELDPSEGKNADADKSVEGEKREIDSGQVTGSDQILLVDQQATRKADPNEVPKPNPLGQTST